MSLVEHDTPYLLLDTARLDRNLARMSARAKALGVRLRPHMKTTKSVEVGQRGISPNQGRGSRSMMQSRRLLP